MKKKEYNRPDFLPTNHHTLYYTHSSMEYLQSRECLRVGTLEKKIRQPGSHCSGAKRPPPPRAVGKAVERQELLN